MASIVEHHLRHNWDLAPRRNESRHRWDICVDATYDYYHESMVQWLTKPLQAAQNPEQGQREDNPSNSEKPPQEQKGHQPQDRPEDDPWRRLGLPERGPGVV